MYNNHCTQAQIKRARKRIQNLKNIIKAAQLKRTIQLKTERKIP
jgi:hypothetical protein